MRALQYRVAPQIKLRGEIAAEGNALIRANGSCTKILARCGNGLRARAPLPAAR